MATNSTYNIIVHTLRLLKYLRLHGLTKSDELSKEINVTKRSLTRYFGALKELGYPITSKSGKNGGYYLDEPFITQSDWQIIRDSLPKEVYWKIEYRLLEEFKPSE